jgi:4-hydroxy-2-oxoheptanedioate aldolase
MSNRLNGVIRAFEEGKPAFTCFAKSDKQSAIDLSDSPYDGLIVEMEHNPFDMAALGDFLQYLLNRKQIHNAATVAPAVTPLVRIPRMAVRWISGRPSRRWIAASMASSRRM